MFYKACRCPGEVSTLTWVSVTVRLQQMKIKPLLSFHPKWVDWMETSNQLSNKSTKKKKKSFFFPCLNWDFTFKNRLNSQKMFLNIGNDSFLVPKSCTLEWKTTMAISEHLWCDQLHWRQRRQWLSGGFVLFEKSQRVQNSIPCGVCPKVDTDVFGKPWL